MWTVTTNDHEKMNIVATYLHMLSAKQVSPYDRHHSIQAS
jgi:hypothetical protein